MKVKYLYFSKYLPAAHMKALIQPMTNLQLCCSILMQAEALSVTSIRHVREEKSSSLREMILYQPESARVWLSVIYLCLNAWLCLADSNDGNGYVG